VPSIVFVTTPYYLAMIYAAGSFGEFTAVSVVPLLFASALSLLRADRLRLAPAAALAASVTIFTGSHNITLLWGSAILLVLGAAIVLAVAPARRLLTRRGVGRVAAVVVLAVMVNGWFLLPDIVYQSHTIIANWSSMAKNQLQNSMWLVARGSVLSLGRSSASPDVPHLALQLPVLPWLWILVGLVLSWRSWRSAWFRTIMVLLLVSVALVVLMESFGLLWELPRPFNNVQFSYRLETWIVLFSVGALVGVAVLLGRAGRRRSRWVWVLPAIVAYSIFGAVWQLRQQPPSAAPEWTSASPYYTDDGVPNAMDYGSADLAVSTDQSLPLVGFPVVAERGDRTSFTIPGNPGDRVQTNLITIPELVTVHGGRIVAREPWGHAIIEITETQKPGVVDLGVTAARPWPVVGGRVCSLLGILGLASIAVMISRRRVRGRRTLKWGGG
jgi:hypothetical protein